MRKIIQLFARRPLVGNIITFGVILCAIAFWDKIGKEQMPDLTLNWIRITVPYPGASAEDVELFITKPIEEKLKGVVGLDEVSSISASGNSTFSIIFEPQTENLSEKIQEVKDAIEAVELPRDVEQPVYRQYKSRERAFIDVGLFFKDIELLEVADRIKLQELALSFKNRLLAIKEVSAMDANGYLRPEIQIKVDPEKLRRFEISMQNVIDQIQQQNVRTPVGTMTDRKETEITVISELDDIGPLENVIVSSGFEGQKVRLKEIATIERGFEKTNSITKVQGREGIIFSVQKSISVDILSAQKAVSAFIKEFRQNNPDSPVDYILMDDESYEVRNRLSLIASNGIMGFFLIVVILFIFLDLRAGLWVAVGIPFSLSATLICAMLMGFTINNMTLAAIIIVLGIVVDDAIIVAENITRRRESNVTLEEAAVERTANVFLPILASMLTTCAAFVPLYFFSGRFGLFVVSIPTIVFLMLFASLIESTFILPGHMIHDLPGEKYFKNLFKGGGELRNRIVYGSEEWYRGFLLKILPYRSAIFIAFILLLGGSAYLYKSKLKYVMFPREEAQSISLKVVGPKEVNRKEMAKLVGKIEQIFLEHNLGIVVNVRTSIGMSRRGGEVKENEASLRIELVPPSEREILLDDAIVEWQKKADQFKEFKQVKFLKDRFGSESGSPIVIEVQENNDKLRAQVAQKLVKELGQLPGLTSIEVETPVTKAEYRLHVKDFEVSRLAINFDQLSSILRSYVQGQVLYTLNSGEEEVDIRLTGADENKKDIDTVLGLTVANRQNYLVPVKELVTVEAGRRPSNIQRTNFKRTVKVYADIKEGGSATPLDIAEKLERDIFPKILQGNISTVFNFLGEVRDSRESQSDFSFSVILVIILIYMLLVFLFNSLWTPLLIGTIIPFGIVGVILTLTAHGMEQYGFFAVVGTLGLIGIVINDSIVLIDKLQEEYKYKGQDQSFSQIAAITSTRLRAVIVTTLTTVIGLIPTAYGWGGYDSMLAEMMIVMAWGLLFATLITLVLVPCLYSYKVQALAFFKKGGKDV